MLATPFPLEPKQLNVIVRSFGLCNYQDVWQQMKAFTDTRSQQTPDEIWCLQHTPVFTQGLAGKPEHLHNPGNIPVIQTDRGGQITYHGPGQLLVYLLLDLRRLNMGVRRMVRHLEQAVINLLADFAVTAQSREDAPGVYVTDGAKICSVGLRVRRGCSYHGIALNIDMDLQPFSRINPCGFRDLKITQLSDFVNPISLEEVEPRLLQHIKQQFGYTGV